MLASITTESPDARSTALEVRNLIMPILMRQDKKIQDLLGVIGEIRERPSIQPSVLKVIHTPDVFEGRETARPLTSLWLWRGLFFCLFMGVLLVICDARLGMPHVYDNRRVR
jgi:hypothetical protein